MTLTYQHPPTPAGARHAPPPWMSGRRGPATDRRPSGWLPVPGRAAASREAEAGLEAGPARRGQGGSGRPAPPRKAADELGTRTRTRTRRPSVQPAARRVYLSLWVSGGTVPAAPSPRPSSHQYHRGNVVISLACCYSRCINLHFKWERDFFAPKIINTILNITINLTLDNSVGKALNVNKPFLETR